MESIRPDIDLPCPGLGKQPRAGQTDIPRHGCRILDREAIRREIEVAGDERHRLRELGRIARLGSAVVPVTGIGELSGAVTLPGRGLRERGNGRRQGNRRTNESQCMFAHNGIVSLANKDHLTSRNVPRLLRTRT